MNIQKIVCNSERDRTLVARDSPCLPLSLTLSPSSLFANRDHKVIENTRSHVKIESTLTNFVKLIRIEGYNGKYGSNLQRISEIFYVLFEFDQIRHIIGHINRGKWHFMNEGLKTNPRNKKSMNLTLI